MLGWWLLSLASTARCVSGGRVAAVFTEATLLGFDVIRPRLGSSVVAVTAPLVGRTSLRPWHGVLAATHRPAAWPLDVSCLWPSPSRQDSERDCLSVGQRPLDVLRVRGGDGGVVDEYIAPSIGPCDKPEPSSRREPLDSACGPYCLLLWPCVLVGSHEVCCRRLCSC